MMKSENVNHNILSLMLGIAELENHEAMIALFVEELAGIFALPELTFVGADRLEPPGGLPLRTLVSFYGWIVMAAEGIVSEEKKLLCRDAVKMLTLMLQQNEQRQVIAAKTEASMPNVDQRILQLQNTNVELSAANIELRKEVNSHEKIVAEMKEFDELFNAFLEQCPIYVFFKDDKQRSLKFSRNYEQLLNRPIIDLLGKTVDEYFPQRMAKAMMAADRKILAEGRAVSFEEKLNDRTFSTTKFPLPVQGKPDHLAGFTIDITELKAFETALKESEQFLARSQEIAHVGGWNHDIITDRITWSDEVYRIFGVDQREVIPSVDNFFAFVHPDDREAVEQAFWTSAEECQETYEVEHRIIRRDTGEIRYVREKCCNESNAEGKIINSLGMIQDITEQKKAEELIASERERLAVTLRSIGDGVITTDTNGKIVLINRVAEEMTGWSQADAKGKPLTDVFNIINELTRVPCENPVQKVLATGGIIELENHTVLIARDGSELSIADSGAPIKDASSNTIGVVLVFRDMTEKIKMVESLQRTDKLEAIGVLAGGIAHDFNNLLSGIFGFIELARMGKDRNQTLLYLDQAMIVFNRATNLTQQLLTFSKGGEPQRRTGNLGALVKEATLFSLSGTNIVCEFFMAEDLWTADFDKGQIGQVIDNMVINAQQAMPMGGKLVVSADNTVLTDNEIAAFPGGRYVRLSFADTGIGMLPSMLKKIFDPFFTTKQKGNGLGLATSYAIIQKHSGCIEVKSVIGKGTTFDVYLPASIRKIAEPLAAPTKIHRGQGCVLIMDDEAFVRSIVCKLLESMGYTTSAAKDGAEALELIDANKGSASEIAAAIFDITVPGGMGGKEAIRLLRQKYPDLPVFASSGYSEDPVIAQPADYGFTDSLRKPYRREELMKMLNRHLNPTTQK